MRIMTADPVPESDRGKREAQDQDPLYVDPAGNGNMTAAGSEKDNAFRN